MSVHKNIYGQYSVPNDNTPAATDIRNGRVYEPDTIKFIIKNCGEKSIIHGGTYFGDFLPALGKNVKGMVYSFEPNNINYGHARETINLNNLDNVILDNVALSDEFGVVTMKVANNSVSIGGGSHIVDDNTNEAHQDFQKTNTITLDDFMVNKEEVSIIQLDVERYEEKALRGGLETIKKYMPIIIIENKPTSKFFTDNLKPLGYMYHQKKLHHNSILYTNEHKLIF
jgi:FkbM family methyltransferase